MSIYQKLQTIRVALQEEQIKKTGHNNFSDYDYYELKDFLPAINRHCLTHKITPIINFSDENYVTLTLHDFEKSDEKIVFYSPKADATVKGAQSIQNLGATETYQRRYLYLMAFEVAESDTVECTQEKDKESKTKSNQNQSTRSKPEQLSTDTIDNNKLGLLIKTAAKDNLTESDVLAVANFKFGINQLTELKMPQFLELMSKIPALRDEFLKSREGK